MIVKDLQIPDFRKSLVVKGLELFSEKCVLRLRFGGKWRTLYYMRQTTELIKKAFEQGKSLKVNNTSTDGQNVFLFGNRIISRLPSGKIIFSLAGHPTVTTRERIRGILSEYVYQHKHEQYLPNGKEIADYRDWFYAGSGGKLYLG